MNQTRRPLIDYPCNWSYRVIGFDRHGLTRAVEECCQGYDYQVAASNTSRSGKYLALAVSVRVENEAARDGLYRSLAGHPQVKTVL
ncbi:MAG: YbeD family protein [Desulfosudaceae bacterium]